MFGEEPGLVFLYCPGLQRKGVSVMNLSDMVGRNQAPEGNRPLDKRTDFMNMRKIQPGESLTEKLLSSQASHISSQASHTAEYERGITDHLIRGLVDRLPKPDGIWPLDDRAKWLRTAAGIFDLVYKAGDGEHREISIAFVKQEAANSPMS
jgi:hypothetical protein